MLHVTNGESAGNTLRQTSLGGVVLSWQDVLHEGPLPAGPRGKLLSARATFLSECGWGPRADIRSSLDRRDRVFLDALHEGVQVVLWFEHDLFDQLQLVDALSLAAGAPAAPELIVVSTFPGKPSFRGLGELTAVELETLWPLRVGASPEILASALSAWDAVRTPDPAALAAWTAANAVDQPLLAEALSRLLEELPAPRTGLNGTERRTLRAISGGAATPIDAFLAYQDAEAAPFLGDVWFFRALAALGRGERRLVETTDGGELPLPPPLSPAEAFVSRRLRLTPAGEEVLRGEADRVELLGVDRWVGGTHLTPANAWRWDPAERRLTGP
jgi:hypothetical protein